MKDELPESFKKGLEAVERAESQKTTPTTAKETTPTEKTPQESTPAHEKDKVSNLMLWSHDFQLLRALSTRYFLVKK